MKKLVTAHILALLACIACGAFLAYLLGQDLNWDLLNYHWYNPWALLHHRLLFDIQPAGGVSYNNPFLDLPSYLLRTHFRPIIAGTILGGIQGINGWLVFEITHTILKTRIKAYLLRFSVALTIGLLSLFGAASISELGNSMGDNLTSLFILAALLLLMLSFDRFNKSKHARYLRICGYFLGGMAIGLKLTSLVYVIPLFLCGLLITGNYKTKIRESLWHALAISIGVITSAGYWYFEVWRAFGNPIFPFYNAVFKSPYYWNVNLFDTMWFPTNFFDKVFYPLTFTHLPGDSTKPLFRDPRLAVLLVIVLVAIGYLLIQKLILKVRPRLRASRQEGAFLIFIIISFIIWEKEFSYYRYLLPVELLSLAAIALLAYKLINSTKLATVIIAFLFSLITLYTIPLNWGRIPWQPYNFGPDLKGQLSHVNGTVLMAPTNPLGFLVPYLPAHTRAISVADFNALTAAEKKLIMSDIHRDESNHKSFYAIETANGVNETKYFREVGFINGKCSPLDTYVGQYLYNGALKYKICKLVKIQDNS